MAALCAETIEWLRLVPTWATMLLALVAVVSSGLRYIENQDKPKKLGQSQDARLNCSIYLR